MSADFKHPDVRLEVDGKLYGGWTKIKITRGLDQLAGDFELEVTERWPGQEEIRFVSEGSACRVLIDDTPVITGYVDDVTISYDAGNHTVGVTGRDKTCDLIDCCPPSTQLKNQTLAALAQTLCAPFGVAVVSEVSTPAMPATKTDEGDTVYDILHQHAQAAAVLLYTDGQGRLVIGRAGNKTAGAAVELGKNVLRCSYSASMKERYSLYTVKGQSAADDTWNGTAAAHPTGTAKDPFVSRHRPLTIIAEQEAHGVSAAQRAQWEANTRYGKGKSVTYTVNGWYGGDILWEPNQMIQVTDSLIPLDNKWLIVSVAWSMDDGGWISALTIQPKSAYELIPVKKTDSGGTKSKEPGLWK